MFTPYPIYWYVPYGRPAPIAARVAMLTGAQPGPVLGGLGAGPDLILTGLGFFAHGNPVGGPTGEAYRGVSASSFPAFAIVAEPGAQLAPEWTGLAGAPLGTLIGRGGVPIR
jgi:hypothetical protein